MPPESDECLNFVRKGVSTYLRVPQWLSCKANVIIKRPRFVVLKGNARCFAVDMECSFVSERGQKISV